MKKFWQKLKRMYAIYKTLEEPQNQPKPQKMSDLNIRPDYCAFLTCPYPVLDSEKSN